MSTKNKTMALNILGVIVFALGFAISETGIMIAFFPSWTVAGSYSASSFFVFTGFTSGLLIGFGILLIRRDA